MVERIFRCQQCGKLVTMVCGNERIYCSQECRRKKLEMEARRRGSKWLKAKEQNIRTFTEPPVPSKMCTKCLYGGRLYRDYPGCNYMAVTGKSRVLLHPDGMPEKCQEFEPKQGRKLRATFSMDGGETSFVASRFDTQQDRDDLEQLQKKILAYAK